MSDYRSYLFCVADLPIRVAFSSNDANGIQLWPSFSPFAAFSGEGELFMDLVVDDSLPPVDKSHRERIRVCDTGNGDTIVDQTDDGGYQFIIKDIDGQECCLLIANSNFSKCRCALNGNEDQRTFGLNNALILCYAFAGSFRNTILVHASLVRHNGRGYAFIAQSGTGKSTQVSNWLRYIPDCDLMNDDNPVVRVIGEEVFVYGTPWSGKTPCYRDVKAPLAAVTRIERCERNWVEKLPTVAAFASFLPSCSTMRWDKRVFDNVCNCISDVIRFSELYTLHCLPDRESAEVCHSMIDHE